MSKEMAHETSRNFLALSASLLPTIGGDIASARDAAVVVEAHWKGALGNTDCSANGVNITCSHELDSQRAGSLGALALTPCTETEVATGGTGVRLGCSVSTGSTSSLVTTGTVASRACTTATTSSSSTRRILYQSETLNTNFSIPVTAIYKSGKMEIEGTGPDSTGTWTATLVARR